MRRRWLHDKKTSGSEDGRNLAAKLDSNHRFLEFQVRSVWDLAVGIGGRCHFRGEQLTRELNTNQRFDGSSALCLQLVVWDDLISHHPLLSPSWSPYCSPCLPPLSFMHHSLIFLYEARQITLPLCSKRYSWSPSHSATEFTLLTSSHNPSDPTFFLRLYLCVWVPFPRPLPSLTLLQPDWSLALPQMPQTNTFLVQVTCTYSSFFPKIPTLVVSSIHVGS